jgi:hypothetical protein
MGNSYTKNLKLLHVGISDVNDEYDADFNSSITSLLSKLIVFDTANASTDSTTFIDGTIPFY